MNKKTAVMRFFYCLALSVNNILTFNFGMLRKIYILVGVKI